MNEEDQRRMDEKVDAFIGRIESRISALFGGAEPEKPRFLSTNKRIILGVMALMMTVFFAILPHDSPDDILIGLFFSVVITILMTLIASLCLWVVSLILRQPKPHALLKKGLDYADGAKPAKKPDAEGR